MRFSRESTLQICLVYVNLANYCLGMHKQSAGGKISQKCRIKSFRLRVGFQESNVWNMFKFSLEISLSRTTVEYLADNINFYSSSISLVILIKL